jgi:hypothetical protein
MIDKGDVATLIFLEALKTRREGMIAENAFRAHRGEVIAYGESEFQTLEIEIRALLQRRSTMSEPREWTRVQWLSEVVANYLEHCRAELIRPCQEFEQALRRLIEEHGEQQKRATRQWFDRVSKSLFEPEYDPEVGDMGHSQRQKLESAFAELGITFSKIRDFGKEADDE